jgi:hypothetical protein
MTVSGIKCPRCWDCIYSASGHDFRYCFCGYCFVDGGRNYLRYGWGGPEWGWEDKPEIIDIDVTDYVRGGLRA